MDGQEEIVREFLIETYESLDRLDQLLVQMEQHPRELTTINNIFRIFHTIKGTCGFLEFFQLEAITHAGEYLLDSLRTEKLILNDKMVTALLELVDAVRKILTSIEQSGREGDFNFTELTQQLASLNHNWSRHGTRTETLLANCTEIGEATTLKYTTALADGTDLLDQMTNAHPSITENNIDASHATIRVDIGLLDSLMILVDELVYAGNQILQFTKTQNDAGFLLTAQQLNLITSELQESVRQARKQPIASVWNQLPLVVRESARICGKQVRIEFEGEEIELDKTVLTAIKDPLMHIVRNAVDHGIETPKERTAQGKPAEGVLSLRAFPEWGNIVIEIRDDGAGLNVTKIKAKVLATGLLSPEELDEMSEDEIKQLIFLPGFSTAEQITSISGRGVGMDVVRSNIEKVGGMVELLSEAGQGTTLKIQFRLNRHLSRS